MVGISRQRHRSVSLEREWHKISTLGRGEYVS